MKNCLDPSIISNTINKRINKHNSTTNVYVYVAYEKRVNNKIYEIFKKEITDENINSLIQKFNKLRKHSNVKYVSFGVEYVKDSTGSIGALDLFSITA